MPKAYAVVTSSAPQMPFRPYPHAASASREHGLKERTVVTEYPSLEKATAAYDSAAYAEALKALGDGAARDFRIVEGVE